MIKYIVKRLGSLGVVLVGTSIVVFALVHLQPGNPYSTMINPNVSPERFEAIESGEEGKRRSIRKNLTIF